MGSQGVRHVRDLVLRVCSLASLGHRTLVLDIFVRRRSEPGFGEAAPEDLHDAVRIGVAMQR